MFENGKEIEEALKNAMHRFDLICKPYCMIIHPKNLELCEQVLKEIGQFDDYVICESEFMDTDKIVVMDRKDLENYANPIINFDIDYFFDDNAK